MTIYDLRDNEGRVFAFEVSSSLGRVGVRAIVEQIPRVKILRSQGYFSRGGGDIRCEFEFNGTEYKVYEPFGDNSRYWIGPKDHIYKSDIQIIRSVFLSAKRPWFTWLSSLNEPRHR